MPILDQNNPQAVMRYNAFVRNAAFTCATQDLMWATVKDGWGSVQVYVEANGEMVGAMSLLVKKTFGYTMLYAPKGPVCDVYNLPLVQALLEEVKAYAKANRAFVLRMDPERNITPELEALYKANGFIVRNTNHDKDELIQPRYNMVLSLEGEDETSLLAQFAQKTRYNINLARKKGVTVTFDASDEALDIFYELSEVMCKRQTLFNRPKAYFKKMLKAFEGQSRIYLAKHEDDYLSAAIGILYGGKLWYIYGASSNEKRNLMPNYLMQWEMIRWGLEAGATSYDFGGVFELNKEDGLFKFKEGFCRKEGVTELIGEIDFVYKPHIYHLVMDVYPKLKKLRSKWLNRKRS